MQPSQLQTCLQSFHLFYKFLKMLYPGSILSLFLKALRFKIRRKHIAILWLKFPAH